MIVVICDCPVGAVTDTVPGLLACTSILYPGGRNVLKPTISSGCPLNSDDTLLITPGVSMLENKCSMSNIRQNTEQHNETALFSRLINFPVSSESPLTKEQLRILRVLSKYNCDNYFVLFKQYTTHFYGLLA